MRELSPRRFHHGTRAAPFSTGHRHASARASRTVEDVGGAIAKRNWKALNSRTGGTARQLRRRARRTAADRMAVQPVDRTFKDRDPYVIVCDLTGKHLAHGANAKLVGKDLIAMKAPTASR